MSKCAYDSCEGHQEYQEMISSDGKYLFCMESEQYCGRPDSSNFSVYIQKELTRGYIYKGYFTADELVEVFKKAEVI